MGRLTIKLRISAYALFVAVAFASFMILFFPWQAGRLGDRVMKDTAVTIAAMFSSSIEPAFDQLGGAGDVILAGALSDLSSELTEGGVREGMRGRARRDESESVARIAVESATVFSDAGKRLAGFNDEDQRAGTAPQRELSVVATADGHGLRVTAPVFSRGVYKGFFQIDFSTRTFADIARANLWTCIAVSLFA